MGLTDVNNCLITLQTHICVEQTSIELLSRNLKVHIIADASTSRNQADRYLAFEVNIYIFYVTEPANIDYFKNYQ